MITEVSGGVSRKRLHDPGPINICGRSLVSETLQLLRFRCYRNVAEWFLNRFHGNVPTTVHVLTFSVPAPFLKRCDFSNFDVTETMPNSFWNIFKKLFSPRCIDVAETFLNLGDSVLFLVGKTFLGCFCNVLMETFSQWYKYVSKFKYL